MTDEKETDIDELQLDFSNKEYQFIDEIKEKIRIHKSKVLKRTLIKKKLRKQKETQKINFRLEEIVYKKLKEESDTTGVSMQDILRNLLRKRYRMPSKF